MPQYPVSGLSSIDPTSSWFLAADVNFPKVMCLEINVNGETVTLRGTSVDFRAIQLAISELRGHVNLATALFNDDKPVRYHDYHNSPRPNADGTYNYYAPETWQAIRERELNTTLALASSENAHKMLERGSDVAPAAWGIR